MQALTQREGRPMAADRDLINQADTSSPCVIWAVYSILK